MHSSAARLEDHRLITGAGRYAADWNLPGQLHAAFLRAERAHARIVSVDVAAARTAAGVVAVLTGEDAVRAGYTKYPNFLTFAGVNGMRARIPERAVLAQRKVRFVGEPVALVVATTALAAQDAAELIAVEYEDLPVAVTPEAALAGAAPLLHDDVPGNLAFEYEAGDAGAVAAAFAGAAHVARLKVASTRVAPNPMEPRACLVAYAAATDRFTVHVPLQGINLMRKQLAAYAGVPEDSITVVAQDVGGGFGQRSQVYPEYCALMLAAKQLGRPVKWVASRSEGFLSDTHGRAITIDGALALDRAGKFLAMRLDFLCDMGAYLTPTGAISHIRNPATCLTGVYRVPALYGHWRVALTNAVPVAAYRGAGRPDIAYAIERLVDHAAAEIGMDPVALRRRNFIPPQAFPYKTPTGSTYEYAEFEACLDQALAASDWPGFAGRREQARARGKLRGIGISTVIENTGAGMFPKDQIELEVDDQGRLTIYSVSQSQGQGHETSFAMIVADALGVPLAHIRLRQSVAARPLIGNHTGGSRSTVGAGSACKLAADKLIEHGKSLAADKLNVEPSQIEYAAGAFRVRGSDRTLALAELARTQPGGHALAVTAEGTFGSTFPNGCHIAEVEVDPDTGAAAIVRYVAVDDCGQVINHAVVEGQMHGAVTQGAGQVFGEQAVYDSATGQLLTGSFADYYMPRAGLLRDIRLGEHPTPSKVSPLGVKGMGESGCTASLGALTNAVIDALRPLGIAHLDMPLTPARVWQAIVTAKGGR